MVTTLFFFHFLPIFVKQTAKKAFVEYLPHFVEYLPHFFGFFPANNKKLKNP